MPASTTTNLNSLFDLIREDALFVLREQNVMGQLVTNARGTGMANRQIPIFSQSNVSEIAEGVDFSNPTLFEKTLLTTVIPKETIAQFLLTDQMLATNDQDDIMASAADEIGGGISEKVDTDLTAEFANFTTNTLGSAGTNLSIATAAGAIALLRNQKARGPVVVVLHPFQWSDVWAELGQPTANQALLGDTANEALRDYFVGRFLAANWVVSTNIAVDGNADAIAGIFTREALIFDERRALQIEPERDASLRATELNGTIWYGTGVRRETHGVAVTADATTPS